MPEYDPEYEYRVEVVYDSGVETGYLLEEPISEGSINSLWHVIERAQEQNDGNYYTEAKILRRPKAKWEVVREL